MTHDEYLAAIRSEVDAMAEVARTAPLDTNVPSCPKWTIADLVEHTSRAHRWATANLAQAPADGPIMDQQQRPEDEAVADWLEAGSGAFLDKLSSVEPSQPCWTWTDDHTAGFWARRMAHETAVHLWDAQNAAGAPQPVPPAMAVDGIDEIFELIPFFNRFSNNTEPWGHGETIHFHATDEAGEWLVQLNPDGITVTKEHAKGDAAARGPASDLLLVMFGRKEPSTLELFGDTSLLDRWQKRARF